MVTTSGRRPYERSIGDAASQLASDGKEFASVAVDEASRVASEQATRLNEEYLQPAWHATRKYMKEHPVKTLLMTAAAGALVGAYFRRRT